MQGFHGCENPCMDTQTQRYAHLVEEDVHPYQALCGAEQEWKCDGPEPPICPKCRAIYDGLTDRKEIVR